MNGYKELNEIGLQPAAFAVINPDCESDYGVFANKDDAIRKEAKIIQNQAYCDPEPRMEGLYLGSEVAEKVAEYQARIRELIAKLAEVDSFLQTPHCRIVSSGDLTVLQIAEAQACGRFYVHEPTGYGWAALPWFLTTEKDELRMRAGVMR